MDLQATLDKALAEAQEEDWEDGEEEYDEEDYDPEAEAEEIAKRLSDQLWADIAKARAEDSTAQATPSASAAPPTSEPPHTEPLPQVEAPHEQHDHDAQPQSPPLSPQARKQDAALITVRTILSFAYKDPVVRATLATQLVASSGENTSVLDVLTRCATSNTIAKELARPLSDAVVALAKSDVLFSSMRNSDAAAIQLDKGKRKRDQMDEDSADDRFAKRAAIEFPDILAQISQAVRTISAAFASQPPTNGPPDPQLIAPIQYPLHQVYLFAVTSAPRARPDQIHILQELGALIQMLGVLSKVPIGPAPIPWGAPAPAPPDIGTAVYPCLVPGCTKTFYRLYSLRTHQRLHALVDRPYRCPVCPASFQRNHDLKRHTKLHDKTAWKCCGCGKIFSRRDAIKRHKDSRGRGGKGHVDVACATADIEEVEVDKEEGEEDATRRAKLWSGIVANQLASATAALPPGTLELHGEHAPGPDDDKTEEGEVPPYVVEHAQITALQLYPIIKSRVAPAAPTAAFPPPPGAVPHPTLASVMARSHPPYQQPPPPPAPDAPANTASEPSPAPEQPSAAASISLSWLSEEQTKLLEEAIAQAAAAAQAQAEAEAALEEEDEEFDEDEDGMDTS
ncbi:C2H2-type zinc finger protein [Phanerochaete sordida]|uniref:C2H2-type zinc finger protein n=1 Tax=Phanerochaete sordida TaxID=48140 RepID=A0A9P3LG69_9APHY|nr:C2H2-type zinc finger protein [Phanerochaete sordida]